MYKRVIECYKEQYSTFAIHSVFIAKENILFLEEWIDYHIQLGFNKFYLYDNSKVTKSGGAHVGHKEFIPGKVSKYNIDFDTVVNLSENEISDILSKIKTKYKGIVDIKEWSPKDKEGNIRFNQEEAHADCLVRLKKDNIDWCANIDLDEYIVIKQGKDDSIKEYIDNLDNVSNIRIGQIRFDSRFNNLDKSVLQINKSEAKLVPRSHSNKSIYKVSETSKLFIHMWQGSGKEIAPNISEIHFNHYKLNSPEASDTSDIKTYGRTDNINKNILMHILSNRKNYFINNR